MVYISFIKSNQNQVQAIAAGYHALDGTLFLGYTTGTTTGATPDYYNYLRQVLARGTWNRIRAVYYEKFNVPESDYEFYNGVSGTNTFFERDSDHPGSAVINVKATHSLGTPIVTGGDTEMAVVFAECELFPDFDANGNQIDAIGNIVSTINEPLNEDEFFYTASPARIRVGWLLKYASNVYNRHSWDWTRWVAYRDFCAGLETVDYRVIPNQKGIGLTVRFFDSTDFTSEVSDAKRIDPYINFETSSGAPALGINAAAFSARYEGFLKQTFTEEFTFTVQRSDTVKLWIDDVLIIDVGATTGTADLTADQFHKIRADWVNSSGDSQFILQWQSANTPLQIIKQEAYFPRVEQRPRYEAHVAISSPATPAFTEPLFDRITNATTQKINGKYVYECFEQKQSSFIVQESDIALVDKTGREVEWQRTGADIQTNQSYDVYELTAGDLDDRYLQTFEPISYYRDPDNVPENPSVNQIAFTVRNVYTVNMTRWQGYKILKYLMARESLKDLKFDRVIAGLGTYPLQGADTFKMSLNAAGAADVTFLITETQDDPPEEAKNRRFVVQEWFDDAEFQSEMELDG